MDHAGRDQGLRVSDHHPHPIGAPDTPGEQPAGPGAPGGRQLRDAHRAVQPAAVIAAVDRVCRPLAEEKGVRLVLRPGPADLSIPPTRRGLEHVLINLVSNAVKFTDGGGLVEGSSAAGAEDFTVAVRDTGIGMTEEQLGHIFTRFYSVTTPTSPARAPGSGWPSPKPSCSSWAVTLGCKAVGAGRQHLSRGPAVACAGWDRAARRTQSRNWSAPSPFPKRGRAKRSAGRRHRCWGPCAAARCGSATERAGREGRLARARAFWPCAAHTRWAPGG